MNNEVILDTKERLAAAKYFNLTADDYVEKITDIYTEKFFDNLENYYVTLGNEIPNLTSTEKLEIIKEIHVKFEGRFNQQLEYFEDYLSATVFRIPPVVVLPDDENIVKAVEKCSDEDDVKQTQKIKELEMRIKQKRVHAKMLNDRIRVMNNIEKSVNCDLIRQISSDFKELDN